MYGDDLRKTIVTGRKGVKNGGGITNRKNDKDFIYANIGPVIQNCKIVLGQKLFNDRFKIATYLQ
ncbi:hypothetical protein Golob_014301, partial [Gossypium lobatum]|nr:hypothetical protein [Gossypium lobatum]